MDALLEGLDVTGLGQGTLTLLVFIFTFKELSTYVLKIIKNKQEIKKAKKEAEANTNINTQILKQLVINNKKYNQNVPEFLAKFITLLCFEYAKFQLIDYIYINKNKEGFGKTQIAQKVKDLKFEIVNELDNVYFKDIKISGFIENSFIDSEKLIECLTNVAKMDYSQLKENITFIVNNSLQATILKIIK